MSLQQCLALADKMLALAENEVEHQRHIVACLERDGQETRMAGHVLETISYIRSERLVMRDELLAAAAVEGMTLEGVPY